MIKTLFNSILNDLQIVAFEESSKSGPQYSAATSDGKSVDFQAQSLPPELVPVLQEMVKYSNNGINMPRAEEDVNYRQVFDTLLYGAFAYGGLNEAFINAHSGTTIPFGEWEFYDIVDDSNYKARKVK